MFRIKFPMEVLNFCLKKNVSCIALFFSHYVQVKLNKAPAKLNPYWLGSAQLVLVLTSVKYKTNQTS